MPQAAAIRFSLGASVFGVVLSLSPVSLSPVLAQTPSSAWQARVEQHAAANGIPSSLVHRVIMRESGYRAHLVGSGGAMGLMQIKLQTARGMGYTGSAAGLLDPDTNMTYAVRYLAGAYRVAGGNPDRAVSNYARGYYAAAKRSGQPVQTVAQPQAVFGLASADSFARASPFEMQGAYAYASRRHFHRHRYEHRRYEHRRMRHRRG